MKIREYWRIWFLLSFVYPGSWKLEKIEAFDFCEVSFSCTQGHKNWRKLKNLIFFLSFMYPGSWKSEIMSLIFLKFQIPGVIKVGGNWSIWILWNFIYPGSWKLEKIEAFDFCEVLSTRGHENQRKLKNLIFVRFRVTGVIKIRKYWSIWFLWSFVFPGS